MCASASHRGRFRVRPHRKLAAAAGSDLCPRREGFRNVLRKIASSPSNRRRADAADHSRSRRAADSCVLETDLPDGQYGMVEEFNEKLIEKVRQYVFLYDTGHPEYKNLVKKLKHGEIYPKNWTRPVSLGFLHTFIYKYWYIIY